MEAPRWCSHTVLLSPSCKSFVQNLFNVRGRDAYSFGAATGTQVSQEVNSTTSSMLPLPRATQFLATTALALDHRQSKLMLVQMISLDTKNAMTGSTR